MFLNTTPLRKHRDYRLLYIGQLVSMFGSMFTYVAVPYQVFEITHSSFMVGMLGAAQLVPERTFAWKREGRLGRHDFFKHHVGCYWWSYLLHRGVALHSTSAQLLEIPGRTWSGKARRNFGQAYRRRKRPSAVEASGIRSAKHTARNTRP